MKRRKTSGIYKIEHIESGKVYVGSAVSIEARWTVHKNHLRRHIHHSIKLQRAWNKYGEGAFTFTIIEVVPDASMLVPREQYWIDTYKAASDGYNISPTAGNCLGVKHKPESVKNYGKWHKGRPLSPEHKAKIAASNRGQKRSPEVCAKISAAKKGKKLSPDHIEFLRALHKGKPKSEEAKRKFSLSRTGMKMSDEARANMSRARKGEKQSPEHCAKKSAFMKGRKHMLGKKLSDEAKAKIAATHKGKKKDPEAIAKTIATKRANGFFEEAAKRLAEANRVRVFSAETRAKMSEAAKRSNQARREAKMKEAA